MLSVSFYPRAFLRYNREMKFSLFALLFLSGCFGGGKEGASAPGLPPPAAPASQEKAQAPEVVTTTTAPALTIPEMTVEEEDQLALAAEILDSLNEPQTIATSLGIADITFDVTLGPQVELSNDSTQVQTNARQLFFSYLRNEKLAYEEKPFLITELHLGTEEAQTHSVLPDNGPIKLGLVSRFVVDQEQNLVRLMTRRPLRVIDWDYQQKLGNLRFHLGDAAVPFDHFLNLQDKAFCLLYKNPAMELFYAKDATSSSIELTEEALTATKVVCQEDQVYLIAKNPAGTFRLLQYSLGGNWQTLAGFEATEALHFYHIQNGLYVRLKTTNPDTLKASYTYFSLASGAANSIASLPKAPYKESWQVRVFKEAASLAERELPLLVRSLKPTVSSWRKVMLPLNSRPVAPARLFALGENEFFVSGAKSLSYFNGEEFRKLGNPNNQTVYSVNKFEDDYFLSGSGAQVLRMKFENPWSFGTPEDFKGEFAEAEKNPTIVADLKGLGVKSVPRMIEIDGELFLIATKTNRLLSSLVKIGQQGEITQSADLNFGLSDLQPSASGVSTLSYSKVAGQKVRWLEFFSSDLSQNGEAQEVSLNENIATYFQQNSDLQHLHQTKQIAVLPDGGQVGEGDLALWPGSLALTLNKLFPLPNGKFLGIVQKQLALITLEENNAKVINKEFLYDLTVAGVTAVDYAVQENSVFVADKFGEIHKIVLPMSKIYLK